MNKYDFFQIAITIAVLLITAPFVGRWIYRVYEGPLPQSLHNAEVFLLRCIGVKSIEDMHWSNYAAAVLSFNLIGLLIAVFVQMTQSYLPLNPQQLGNVSWHSAINTAVSFMTNTNWQGYGGEVTLSYFTQMSVLTVQNFVSAATGMAVGIALMRGLSRKQSDGIGNFWTDLFRGTFLILVPVSVVMTILLMGQGVVQNFLPYTQVRTLEGVEQTLPQGPAASQVAIKQLGTNGGGFFNANSAHPFENPTPLSNWLQLISILLFPAGFVFAFGEMVKSRSQASTLFVTMMVLLCVGLGLSLCAEYNIPGELWMEGKETRFGVTNSVLWSVFTTAASNGSVNAMHGSLSPLAGAVALFNMMVGEVIFGGVGAGFYGMILFVLMTVFLAGLMVGRTPEYLGKKVEAREMQMVILGILLPSIAILIGSGIAVLLPAGIRSITNSGPRGLTEVLYAFTSAGANNGSALAGLNANTVFYNLSLALTMLIGRFGVIIPILAIAGYMGAKNTSPASPGTFTTDGPIFVILLIGVIIIVGGLTFLPSLSLGPIVEHLLMLQGRDF